LNFVLLPGGFVGSFHFTGAIGGPKLGAFDGAAALLMAMFAAGDLGDDALKKNSLV